MVNKCLYKTNFETKDNILATYRDLVNLRQCSEYLCGKENRVVRIVSPENKKHTDFIVKTLLHLGVSCGQIAVDFYNLHAESSDCIRIIVSHAELEHH